MWSKWVEKEKEVRLWVTLIADKDYKGFAPKQNCDPLVSQYKMDENPSQTSSCPFKREVTDYRLTKLWV